MKNKKAEGSASTFLIATLLGLGAMAFIGILISQTSTIYGTNQIDEFSEYQEFYDEANLVGDEFKGSVDDSNNTGEWPTSEDLTFGKALLSVTKLPALTKVVTKSVTSSMAMLGIPPFVTGLLVLILAIIFIAAIIKIIRGFNNV